VVTARDKLVQLLEDLDRAGTAVVELVRGHRPLEPWTIYPDDAGVFDLTTRSQFYYHAHPGATHEAGHFHTVRLFEDHTAHLVGISIDPSGWPRALFTVNLWAIGDAYEPPERLKRYVRQFQIRADRADPRLVAFVNLMFRTFRPEIEWLQDTKDRALTTYRRAHPGTDPFEDRTLEILSQVEVDLRSQRGGRRSR
jgi:hypothetical protein